METSVNSLDLSSVFILDAGVNIYIWYGNKSSLMSRSKARLITEKIKKHERKNKCTIIAVRAVKARGEGEGSVRGIRERGRGDRGEGGGSVRGIRERVRGDRGEGGGSVRGMRERGGEETGEREEGQSEG